MLGTASLPAWRRTQPSRDESNSLVNRRGNGVGEGAGVAVGSGVNVAGIGVREAGGAEVGKKEGAGVCAAVAGWQAVMRTRHPKRSFFMTLLKHNCPELCSGQLYSETAIRSVTNRSLERRSNREIDR